MPGNRLGWVEALGCEQVSAIRANHSVKDGLCLIRRSDPNVRVIAQRLRFGHGEYFSLLAHDFQFRVTR